MILSLVLAAQLVLSPEIPVAADVIRSAPGVQLRPAIAAGGGDYFAVWETGQPYPLASGGDVVGARIRATGEVIDRHGGLPMQPIWVSDMNPSVVWNGSTYVVVFASGPWPWPYGVKAIEVTTGGEVIAERVIVTQRDIDFVDIAWNGAQYLVVWHETGGAVRGLRVDPGLNVTGDELAFAGDGFGDVAVASNGANFLTAWQTTSGAFAATVSSSGAAGSPVSVSTAASTIDVASNGVSYAVFGNAELVALDDAARITRRTPVPAGIEGALAWNGLRYVAAWSAGDRIFAGEYDAALNMTRAPQRLTGEESIQRSPAVANDFVLWSDGTTAADIRGAFIGAASTSRLISSGLTNQTPAGAAWSGETLGILWHEGDGVSASLRLGLDRAEEGIAFAPASEARLATNGHVFAIAAARSGRIEVELQGSTIPVGEGTNPWIASDGRDFLVVWSRTQFEVMTRVVRRDGTLGEAHLLPHVTTGTRTTSGLLWHRGAYVLLVLELFGPRVSVHYTIASTEIGSDGMAATPVTIASGNVGPVMVATRMASNGRDILYVMSAYGLGVVARLGTSGAATQIAPDGHLEAVTWDGREFVTAIAIAGDLTTVRRLLIRGQSREELVTDRGPLLLAGPAIVYSRIIERIPGLDDLSVRRAFVRSVVLHPKRRAARS